MTTLTAPSLRNARSGTLLFATGLAARSMAALSDWLPSGGALPRTSWDARHRQITRVLWFHIAALASVSLVWVARGHAPAHMLAEVGAVALLGTGAAATSFNRTTRAIFATLGLFSCSALIVHMTGGLTEAHFHFFIMVAVVSLYQSWQPFLLGVSFVVLQHGFGAALMGGEVFDHEGASSWWWTLVHGVAILGQSVACLATWRVSEAALRRERDGVAQLRKAHDDLAEAQEISHVGSFEQDLVTGRGNWSPQLFRILGIDPGTVASEELFFAHVFPADVSRLASGRRRIAAEGGSIDVEIRMVRGDGSEITVRVQGRAVLVDGAAVRVVGTVQDVTQQRRLEREIEHRAFHDPLTDLGNRSLFLDRLEHALAVSRRSQAPLTVLYLDLDDFKTVNDSLGHGAGDQLLIGVADRLRRTLRPGDTIARLGGDEFAVLLEDTDGASAERAANRLLEVLALPVAVGDRSIAVRVSLGIAPAHHPLTAEGVMRNADIAMYAAKRQGKASCRMFTPDMLVSVVDRMEGIAELRMAIERNEFVMHYQPIVDLTSGEVCGVEALVRWEHPERGMVPPMEFIPLAEETGLIVPLGAWVTRTATVDLKAMQDELGLPITLNVNLSPQQFSSDVVGMVAGALRQSGLAAEHLILEITEGCVMSQDDGVLAQLAKLRESGVRVAIDDFGMGYSSLAYLRELPIDVLKIDRSFIQHVTEGGEHSALAEAIITLGQAFNLETVAEGIETRAQAVRLHDYGCRTGQGFLYSKPKDAAALLRELSAVQPAHLAS
jgi:diguanylate cyclase (GGDEF)-like protein/PAS domain S-box-containing protein